MSERERPKRKRNQVRKAWLVRRKLQGDRVRWDLRWKDRSGKRHSVTLDPGLGVKERNAAVEAKSTELNAIGDVEEITLKALAERYVKSLSDKSAEHRKKTERCLKEFNEKVGVNWLSELTSAHVEAFKAWLMDRFGKPTVNGRLLALKGMLNYAAKTEPPLLRPGVNPAAPIALLSTSSRKTTWSLEQMNAIINAAPDKYWKALLIVAARTGLRKGDLQAMRWKDVNLDDGSVFVRENKTNAEHTVFVGEAGADLLREIRQEFPEAERVFLDTRGKLTRNKMSTGLKDIVKAALGDDAAEDDRQRWHCFRRSCFTHLAAQHPEAVVHALSGHKSYATTAKYYVGRIDDVARAAAEATFAGVEAEAKPDDESEANEASQNGKDGGQYRVNENKSFNPRWVETG